MIEKEPAHPVDLYVGSRMRLRRLSLGMSQGALAKACGVSFQAIQKYESGGIRVSASRLVEIALPLEVAPAYFFEGLLAPGGETPPVEAPELDREGLALMREIGRMAPGLRDRFLGLAREMQRALAAVPKAAE